MAPSSATWVRSLQCLRSHPADSPPRRAGYKATVSAADVVHAVAALLEAGAAWHRADAATAARDGGEAVTTEAVPVWEESFNLAYDCLGRCAVARWLLSCMDP